MAKASGVYYYLNDNSLRVSGSVALSVIVPMLTQKGRVGELNRVTVKNYDSVLGNDLTYNPHYLGLKRMLEDVSFIDVLRINAHTAVANIYDSESELTHFEELEQDASLSDIMQSFAITHKSAGNWGDRYVRISKKLTSVEYKFTEDSVSVAKFEDIPTTKVGDTSVVAKIYENGELIAALVKDSSISKIQKVENGALVADTFIGTWTTTALSFDSEYTPSYSNFVLEAWLSEEKLYTLDYAKINKNVYSVINSVDFSLISSSENYYQNVDFGELVIEVGTNPNFNLLNTYVKLEGGSNGSMPFASSFDFTPVETSAANIVVTNGLTDQTFLNRLISAASKTIKSVFLGIPPVNSYSAASDWLKGITASEYVQAAWVSDQEETEEAGNVYICPSVSLLHIYANMFLSTGSLNYPPAGPTYGLIEVSNLQETDAETYKDLLKESRINWQRTKGSVNMMWEQRTNYALGDSDLSYASTVFILRDLRAQLIDWAENFNFRYGTPTQLTILERGLDTILSNMKNEGFLVSYRMEVPTFEEAQKQGRALDINIAVSVIQDMEEINYRVTLEAA